MRVPSSNMEATTCNRYKIKIAGSEFQCIEANGEKGKGFIYPDSSNKLPKLYVVKNSHEIYYVGITTQKIRERLRQGFNAKGEHGYYGYKWKNQSGKLVLSIWVLENIEPDEAYRDLETIEAEIVFLCRLHSNQWPESQHEIHFHKSEEFHRKCAQQIYEHIESNNHSIH